MHEDLTVDGRHPMDQPKTARNGIATPGGRRHARCYETMLRRYLRVVLAYRDTQPAAVATLRRDSRSTVTYHALEKHSPSCERRHHLHKIG
jgi:hypothetical protein